LYTTVVDEEACTYRCCHVRLVVVQYLFKASLLYFCISLLLFHDNKTDSKVPFDVVSFTQRIATLAGFPLDPDIFKTL